MIDPACSVFSVGYRELFHPDVKRYSNCPWTITATIPYQ
jgi:hypothetical protein